MSRKNKEKQIPEEELQPEVPEEASGDETETAEEASVQDEDALKKELEAANAKTAEYLAMAQRVQADFENYRKRNESVRADALDDRSGLEVQGEPVVPRGGCNGAAEGNREDEIADLARVGEDERSIRGRTRECVRTVRTFDALEGGRRHWGE